VPLESDRFGVVGGLAADRPLLTSLVIAFGVTALAVMGLAEGPASIHAATTANLSAYLAIVAAPVFITSLGPKKFLRQMAFLAGVAAVLVVIAIAARRAPAMAALLPLELTPVLISVFFVSAFLVLMAPAFSGAVRQFGVSILAAILGSVGGLGFAAWGFSRLSPLQAAPFDAGALTLVVAMTTLGAGLAVVLAVLLSGEIAQAFARGGDNRIAAGAAARQTGAPAFFGVSIAAGVFVIYTLIGGAVERPAHLLALLAAAATLLPSYAVLLLGAGAFSLRKTTEAVAVAENRRRQDMRRAWRPFRSILPPSSSIAFVAIAGVLAVVAAFELRTPLHLAEYAFMVFTGLVAATIFVSVRTALFIAFLQIVGLLLVTWFAQLIGMQIPSLLERLIALALATALFAHFAVSWRDARSPRRKPHEATEAAIIDGAFRFGGGVVVGTAVFLAAYVSGFWPGAAEAATYFVGLAVVGLFISPPLMTALGALLGRD